MSRPVLLARLAEGAAALGVPLAATQAERLIDYLELLARWNATYNLTAVRDIEEMVPRHLLDSLAIAPHVRGPRLIDIGTGAGLPGIPLALLAPDREFTLVDSAGKKARFLREVVRQLGLANVRVEHARAEDLTGQYDCVVARAFASLADFVAAGAHLLAPGGRFLAMKGKPDAAETAALPASFRIADNVPLDVPGLGAARHLVIITPAAPATAPPP